MSAARELLKAVRCLTQDTDQSATCSEESKNVGWVHVGLFEPQLHANIILPSFLFVEIITCSPICNSHFPGILYRLWDSCGDCSRSSADGLLEIAV